MVGLGRLAGGCVGIGGSCAGSVDDTGATGVGIKGFTGVAGLEVGAGGVGSFCAGGFCVGGATDFGTAGLEAGVFGTGGLCAGG